MGALIQFKLSSIATFKYQGLFFINYLFLHLKGFFYLDNPDILSEISLDPALDPVKCQRKENLEIYISKSGIEKEGLRSDVQKNGSFG